MGIDEIFGILAKISDRNFSKLAIGVGYDSLIDVSTSVSSFESIVRITIIRCFQDFSQFLCLDEDLLCGHFDQRPIIVLEENSVLLQHIILNLVDLDEVDDFVLTILVTDRTLFRHDNVVILLGTSDNPLEVVERNFIVNWNKESLILTGKSSVKI